MTKRNEDNKETVQEKKRRQANVVNIEFREGDKVSTAGAFNRSTDEAAAFNIQQNVPNIARLQGRQQNDLSPQDLLPENLGIHKTLEMNSKVPKLQKLVPVNHVMFPGYHQNTKANQMSRSISSQWNCTFCSSGLLNEDSLVGHNINHHLEQLFTSSELEFLTGDRDQFKKYILLTVNRVVKPIATTTTSSSWDKSSPDTMKYKCGYCSIQLTSKLNAIKHMVLKHPKFVQNKLKKLQETFINPAPVELPNVTIIGVTAAVLEEQKPCCTLCPKKFQNPDMLQNHLALCHPENFHVSSKLPHLSMDQFKSYINFMLHNQLSTFTQSAVDDDDDNNSGSKKTQFECPHCSKPFPSRITARNHLMVAHQQILVSEVDKLQRSATPEDILKQSVEIIRESRPRSQVLLLHKCEACPKKFEQRHEVDQHQASFHPYLYFSSFKCEHVSSGQFKLYVTQLLSEEKKSFTTAKDGFTCPHCSELVSSQIKIRPHAISNHLGILSEKLEALQKGVRARDVAGYSHHKRQQCTGCGKSFAKPCSLKIHKLLNCVAYRHPTATKPSTFNLTTTEKKANEITIQPNTTTTSPDAVLPKPNSILQAAAGPPYKCDVCPEKFGVRFRLERHETSVHPETFFTSSKSEHVTTEQFKSYVSYLINAQTETFQLTEEESSEKAKFKCPHCSTLLSLQTHIPIHLVQAHKNILAEKLQDLQKTLEPERFKSIKLPSRFGSKFSSPHLGGRASRPNQVEKQVVVKTVRGPKKKCDICGLMCISWQCLQSHKKEKHANFFLCTCSICHASFATEGLVQMHKIYMHPEIFFMSSKMIFVSAADFKKYVHYLVNKTTKSWRDPDVVGQTNVKYQCEYCNKLLTYKGAKTHLVSQHSTIIKSQLENLQQTMNPNELETISSISLKRTIASSSSQASPCARAEIDKAIPIFSISASSVSGMDTMPGSSKYGNLEPKKTAKIDRACPVCAHLFHGATYLTKHKAHAHPEIYLMSSKAENVTTEQFTLHVKCLMAEEVEAFTQVGNETGGKDRFKCLYCTKFIHKKSAQSHMVRVHADILGKKLEKLQRNSKPTNPTTLNLPLSQQQAEQNISEMEILSSHSPVSTAASAVKEDHFESPGVISANPCHEDHDDDGIIVDNIIVHLDGGEVEGNQSLPVVNPDQIELLPPPQIKSEEMIIPN